MAQIDWNQLQNGTGPKRRFAGANVKMFMLEIEDRNESEKQGRAVFRDVPSISIQWPGMDETVRRIEEQDKAEFPEMYAAFMAGHIPYEGAGTPLTQWAVIPGAVTRELNYLGFRTVEQLSEANDSLRAKLGPNWQYVKKAKEWLNAAGSTQTDVMTLKEQLERATKKADKLEEQVELLLQRIEANEGTRLTGDDISKRNTKRRE